MMKNTFLKTVWTLLYFTIVCGLILIPNIISAQALTENVVKITSARIISLLLITISVSSIFISIGAKKRNKSNRRKLGAIISFLLGLLVVVLSAAKISAIAEFGIGGGKAGFLLALVLALVGILLALRTYYSSPKS